MPSNPQALANGAALIRSFVAFLPSGPGEQPALTLWFRYVRRRAKAIGSVEAQLSDERAQSR
jgi:hypothetical protein